MTIHKYVSSEVIEANRKNSHHSHGPKTAQGKESVRYNALKHGLLARALVFKTDKEQHIFSAYRRRLCEDFAPEDALQMTYLEDLANCEWRLKRATRWEQAIGTKNSTTAVAEKALASGTEQLGISSEHAEDGSRGWRCNELSYSLTRKKDATAESLLTDDPDGVELTAKLTDPVGDLDTILRYQRAIRRDRDNAADRLLKLKKSRARMKK